MTENDHRTVTYVVKASGSEDRPRPVELEAAPRTFPRSASTRYESMRVLGSGGMGTVHLVHDPVIGRNVALKRLNDDVQDEEATLRFAREARVQGQLEHPAVVPVYDVGTSEDGRAFFTMQRIRGQSLADVLEQVSSGKPTTFSRRRLLSLFSQLCACVHYANERGVVHRDIKPMNVMLGAYGEVYLLDWGVAKVASDPAPRRPTSDAKIDAKAGVHTDYGAVMGTLTTMAPEQAMGGHVDARTDVYALGAILFEILTGQRFHPRGEFEEVAEKIIQGIEARPSVRAPEADVAPELEALCVGATRVHPGDRLASAMALRDGIEAYLDGDRDLELRRQSARKHADAAKAAATEALTGDDEDDGARTRALREVGRALAFDPDNEEALATLVRLLTAPPRKIPKEVLHEQEALVRRNLRAAGIFAACVYGYISLNAVSTMRLGVHDTTTFWIAHGMWALAFAAAVVTALRPSLTTLFVTFSLGLATSTFITTVYGPYILVSTLLTMHAVLFSFVRTWRPRIVVIVASCAAWTLSVFGEATGLFPNTVRFVGGDLVIHSDVIGFPPVTTTLYPTRRSSRPSSCRPSWSARFERRTSARRPRPVSSRGSSGASSRTPHAMVAAKRWASQLACFGRSDMLALMIRVACEACRAPFVIDERKMRAHTITMRCPRCGCSFTVSRDQATAPPPVRR